MSQNITPAHLQQWLFDGQEIALFDVREHGQYGEAHLFHGVTLPYSRLELDIRRLAPNPAVRLVIYDQSGSDVAPRAALRLAALGYGNVHILQGGAQGWRESGRQLFAGVHVPSKAFGELVEQVSHTPHVTATQLAQWQARGEPLVVLDGRPFDEYRKMTIPGSVCCPNGELGYRIRELVGDDSTPIVVNCAGRTRSIIGAQTLIDMGLKNPVYALENGTQGWYLADLQLEHGSVRRYPDQVSAAALTRQRNAAEALARRAQVQTVTGGQVQRWAEESGRSLFLCDVRSAEEFAAGSLLGAQHTPGGQLIQATDLYVGVRNARLVLLDADGIRAPIVASWLRQLGHDAYVLADGVESGLSLPVAEANVVTTDVPVISIQALENALKDAAVALIDLRSSTRYRKAHIDGSRWSIRPLLAGVLAQEIRPVVLVADDPLIAQLAVQELPLAQRQQARVLEGGVEAWQAAGRPVREGSASLADEHCIDFLFFTHDRHSGNKDAARQYLAWEIGLLGQMTAQEIASFTPLQPEPASGGPRNPSLRDPLLRTRLVHAARTAKGDGMRGVNVPVTRLSTVLFDSLSEMRDVRKRRDSERLLSYGARGNPTGFALEDLVTELEGGYRTRLFSSGLAAVAQTFLAYLRPGDHVLLTDAVYSPVRRVAQEFLQPFGIEVSYYAADGRGLEAQLQDNTRMVYAEVPGSLLYELCDLPALAALCRPRGILLAVDNTWGSGYLYRPLALGADISIMALTKYLCGHSDVVMGSVCTREEVWAPIGRMGDTLGNATSPDDAWLILRGARTLASRMEVHERQALEVALWLDAHPQVGRVFHPGLATHPQHWLWKRDFSGSNGLLSFELRDDDPALAEHFICALQLFGLGASWGGYESLITVAELTARSSEEGRQLNTVLRLHIGLEDVSALIEDLQRGFLACMEARTRG
ncbi:Rhodanese domain protein/cystathionine beta-lyase [Pseudomonas syringae pv. delphinii]|nr:cystathionine beta-lyase [Pseudomonas syringae group genomosp. 3]KPX20487.1 Rhodanese domain protein/cystathionine beta-lyase [Pseudomonas syringae pv. delphinii]RMP19699.1 Rhodanese domain protein/cystathionine beta-lyase [Pseudomonas syringae pv. delphinii]RMQ21349.1 Rhodanese domain protein/cystathionine beta-lyase [Pseudomonas syringae pv. delphinii]